MFAAAYLGSVDVAEALLEGGVVIEEEDVMDVDEDLQFICYAALHGLAFFKLLVDRGVITLEKKVEGFRSSWRPDLYAEVLVLAIEEEHVELAKYLLENEIDIGQNISDVRATALRMGNLEIYKVLKRRSIDDEELLVKAVKKGYVRTLEALVKSGVIMEVVDKKLREEGGTGLLEMAVMKSSDRVVPILLKTFDNFPDELIMLASKKSSTVIVKTLLNHKGENCTLPKETLLITALANRHNEIVFFLLESDPHLDFPDESILSAAEQEQTTLVEVLLRRKGGRSTVQWGTLLRIATRTRNKGLIQFLFEAANYYQHKSLLDILDEVTTTAAKDGYADVVCCF
ncbi:hypothetical protein HK102_007180 [Quaeritorhiza haematococci]|nr:hypothetical protein HK102_007180 [Quaeritorhiza haematococci]